MISKKIINSMGLIDYFADESMDRLVSRIDPMGHEQRFEWDAMGNLVRVTNARGERIDMTYDTADRLVSKNLAGTETVTFQWDAVNRLVEAVNASGTVGMGYDLMNRVTQVQQPYGTLAYEYDLAGNRTKMTDATGSANYIFDALNRLTQLTDSSGQSFGFQYDALSRLTNTSYPNGTVAQNSFDAASQLLAIQNLKGSNPLASVAYAYNLVGNRTAETREDGNRRDFGYDQVDRLLSVGNTTLPAKNEAFSYDLVGNWLWAKSPWEGGIDSRVHNANNELTEDSGYRYFYDSEGCLIRKESKADANDVTTYRWDVENRLVQVTTPTHVMQYRYNAFGERVAKVVDGVETRYVLDSANVLLELDASNQIKAANTYAGLDNLLARETASGVSYIHRDGLGSTTAISDDGGNVVERYRYSAFGKIEILDASYNLKPVTYPLQSYTWTGREWESESGLYFFRARYYSPDMGRFISQDPMGFGGGDLNLQAYCGNNGINLWDPLGLSTYSVNRTLSLFGHGAWDRNSFFAGISPTHTFTATTNPDGTVAHTYSWGNDTNLRGWNIDRPEDRAAANEALRKGKAKCEGNSSLDPFVQEAYDELNVSANEHANGMVYNNCKTETKNVLSRAKQNQKNQPFGPLPSLKISVSSLQY